MLVSPFTFVVCFLQCLPLACVRAKLRLETSKCRTAPCLWRWISQPPGVGFLSCSQHRQRHSGQSPAQGWAVQLIIWKRERDGNMVDLFLAGWLELQFSVMQPYGVWDEMCLNQWEKCISVIAQGSGETSSTTLGVITLVRPYSRCSTWLHGWCRAFCIGRIRKSLAYFPC